MELPLFIGLLKEEVWNCVNWLWLILMTKTQQIILGEHQKTLQEKVGTQLLLNGLQKMPKNTNALFVTPYFHKKIIWDVICTLFIRIRINIYKKKLSIYHSSFFNSKHYMRNGSKLVTTLIWDPPSISEHWTLTESKPDIHIANGDGFLHVYLQ